MYNKLYPTIIMYSNKLFNKILCKKAYLIITPLATSYLSLKKNTFIVLLLALGLYLPAFQFSFEDIYFSSSALLTYSHKPITKLSLSLSYYIPALFSISSTFLSLSHIISAFNRSSKREYAANGHSESPLRKRANHKSNNNNNIMSIIIANGSIISHDISLISNDNFIIGRLLGLEATKLLAFSSLVKIDL